jgi:hypothetical protein
MKIKSVLSIKEWVTSIVLLLWMGCNRTCQWQLSRGKEIGDMRRTKKSIHYGTKKTSTLIKFTSPKPIHHPMPTIPSVIQSSNSPKSIPFSASQRHGSYPQKIEYWAEDRTTQLSDFPHPEQTPPNQNRYIYVASKTQKQRVKKRQMPKMRNRKWNSNAFGRTKTRSLNHIRTTIKNVKDIRNWTSWSHGSGGHHEFGETAPSSLAGLIGAKGISTSSSTDKLAGCSIGTFFSSVGLEDALIGAVAAFARTEEGDVDEEGIDACACAALLLFLLV